MTLPVTQSAMTISCAEILFLSSVLTGEISSPFGPESSIDQTVLKNVRLHVRVFAIEIVDRLNAANGARFTADQQGFGGRHVALAGDAVQQIAFGDTGCGEDHVIAARHVVQREDFI